MSAEFTKLVFLLKGAGKAPYKEIVDLVRNRFPGQGHVFDAFIDQLSPLARGFLLVPEIADARRSSIIRYWLSEAAQGRGKNFKPVLLRWLWVHEPVAMHDFVSRWRAELGWSDETFQLSDSSSNAGASGQKPDIILAYGVGTNTRPLEELVEALGKKSILTELKIISTESDMDKWISNQPHESLRVLYNNRFSGNLKIDREGNPKHDAEFSDAKSQFLNTSSYVVVLNESFGEVFIRRIDGLKIPYLEMPTGIQSVAAWLEKAVEKIKTGGDSFWQFWMALNEKNDGQQFLELTLEKASDLKPDGVALTLFDIDQMNQINRRFGEELGDTVIGTVRRIISKALDRQSSDVGRCGDDTFYAAVYDGSHGGDFAEALVDHIASYKWQNEAAELRVTCSAGYASLRPNEDVLDLVIRAAMGMNDAKNQGGNRAAEGPLHLPNTTPRRIRRHFS